MKIFVLGAGCPKCKQLEENTKQAVSELKLKTKVNKITKIEEIAEYGVVSTPALIIDDEIKCHGRIPSIFEIKEWLK